MGMELRGHAVSHAGQRYGGGRWAMVASGLTGDPDSGSVGGRAAAQPPSEGLGDGLMAGGTVSAVFQPTA